MLNANAAARASKRKADAAAILGRAGLPHRDVLVDILAMYLAYPGLPPEQLRALLPSSIPRSTFYCSLAVLKTLPVLRARWEIDGTQLVCWYCGSAIGHPRDRYLSIDGVGRVIDLGGYCYDCIEQAITDKLRNYHRTSPPRMSRYVPVPTLAQLHQHSLLEFTPIRHVTVAKFHLSRSLATQASNCVPVGMAMDARGRQLFSSATLARYRALFARPLMQLIAAELAGLGWRCLVCASRGSVRKAQLAQDRLQLTDMRVLCTARHLD